MTTTMDPSFSTILFDLQSVGHKPAGSVATFPPQFVMEPAQLVPMQAAEFPPMSMSWPDIQPPTMVSCTPTAISHDEDQQSLASEASPADWLVPSLSTDDDLSQPGSPYNAYSPDNTSDAYGSVPSTPNQHPACVEIPSAAGVLEFLQLQQQDSQRGASPSPAPMSPFSTYSSSSPAPRTEEPQQPTFSASGRPCRRAARESRARTQRQAAILCDLGGDNDDSDCDETVHCGWERGAAQHTAVFKEPPAPRTLVGNDGLTRYICEHPQCNRQHRPFTRKQDYQKHYRIHTNERPYSCRFGGCDRTFSDPSVRTRHESTHTARKAAKCPDCSKVFKQAGSVRRHWLKVHKKN